MRGSRSLKHIYINNMDVKKMSMDPSFCRKTDLQRKRAEISLNQSWVALRPRPLAKAECANGAVNRAG